MWHGMVWGHKCSGMVQGHRWWCGGRSGHRLCDVGWVRVLGGVVGCGMVWGHKCGGMVQGRRWWCGGRSGHR